MEYLPNYTDDLYQDYLMHHGVLGMKWGVRRYQNADGSLTDEGKARQKRWKGPDTMRYRRLNKKADRGDKLRAEGKTITNEQLKSYYGKVALSAASAYGAYRLAGKNYRMRWGDTKLVDINADTLAIGAAVIGVGYTIKKYKDSSDIRSSYRRERNGEYWAG